MPHAAIAGPAVAGPIIRPKLLPIVLTAMAPTSLSEGTIDGTIAERTGDPIAMKMPEINDPTIAQLMVMFPEVTIHAITMVIANAPAWLTTRRVLLFI